MQVLPSSSRSSSAAAKEEKSNGRGDRATLFLNVYDLTPMNSYLYWFGLGIFHSGIEVHGLEYGFGAHDYSTSGVFEVEPRSCPGFIFRRSVAMGSTDMSRAEFQSFMEHLAGKYHGDTYHLIAKNCNHFTDEVCTRLAGKPIPGWVNRLARLGKKRCLDYYMPFARYGENKYYHGTSVNCFPKIPYQGSFCNCILPESIQITTVRHLPEQESISDGSDSEGLIATIGSEDESEDDDMDHLLLTTPIVGNVAFLKERQVSLNAELIS